MANVFNSFIAYVPLHHNWEGILLTIFSLLFPSSFLSSIKPDGRYPIPAYFGVGWLTMDAAGVQRGLVGPIIARFEQRGYKLAAIKLVTPGKEHLEQHCQLLPPKLHKYRGLSTTDRCRPRRKALFPRTD